MDGYISKPVNQDRLFHTLWRLLRTRGRLPEVGGPETEEVFAGTGLDHNLVGVDHRLPATGTSTDNGHALPPTLPGIDIGRTLQALEIDGPTFIRILGGFRAYNQDMVEKLRHARTDNDMELMRQLAHGLKGSAANIGAAELSAAAHALEDACAGKVAVDTGSPHIEGLINDVAAALNQVLASIQMVVKSQSDHRAAPDSAETCLALDALLARLVEAIDRADPEQIMTLMPAIRQKAGQGGQLEPSSLNVLEKQLARYDYDEALETIQRITEK